MLKSRNGCIRFLVQSCLFVLFFFFSELRALKWNEADTHKQPSKQRTFPTVWPKSYIKEFFSSWNKASNLKGTSKNILAQQWNTQSRHIIYSMGVTLILTTCIKIISVWFQRNNWYVISSKNCLHKLTISKNFPQQNPKRPSIIKKKIV